MNKNILIVMGGGLMMAIVVAALVSFGLSGNQTVVEEGRVEILVAAQDLKIGTELSDSDMKWQSWPEGAVFSGAIRREGDEVPSDVLEGRLARSVSMDEPMLKSAIVKDDKGNFVAALLRPGHRGVAISVKAEGMAGGFIMPGDFVDVLLTYKITIDDNDDPRSKMIIDRNISKFATETILQNVKVLAIDQTAQKEDDVAKVGKTVTLEVDHIAAEKLALSEEMGELTLALRGIGDDTVKSDERDVTTDVRMTKIIDQIYEEYYKSFSKTRPVPGKSGGNIRVYNGSDIEEVPAR